MDNKINDFCVVQALFISLRNEALKFFVAKSTASDTNHLALQMPIYI